MKWINRNDQEPDPKLDCILVWGHCGCPHIAFRDYDEWVHTECCYESGNHYTGEDIEFTYWKRIPKMRRNNGMESKS